MATETDIHNCIAGYPRNWNQQCQALMWQLCNRFGSIASTPQSAHDAYIIEKNAGRISGGYGPPGASSTTGSARSRDHTSPSNAVEAPRAAGIPSWRPHTSQKEWLELGRRVSNSPSAYSCGALRGLHSLRLVVAERGATSAPYLQLEPHPGAERRE